jgi:hypothetical protein
VALVVDINALTADATYSILEAASQTPLFYDGVTIYTPGVPESLRFRAAEWYRWKGEPEERPFLFADRDAEFAA